MAADATTFHHTHIEDGRRRVTVEVGDSKQPDFLPQFKTLHWNNEANFSIRLVDDEPGRATVRAHRDGGVEWVKPGRVARWYPLEARDHGSVPHLLEDGGHEFEVELAERPASNVLRFTVRAKQLRFYLQPPADPADPDGVVTVPDAVVGSYAVYHESKAYNRDDVHYRTGKAFHILRPHAEDANGERAWCDLVIPEDGNGDATITVPQEFLDDAAYPVVVDPTMGYTSIGGTSAVIGLNSNAVGSLHLPYTASTGDTVTDLDIYADGNGVASRTVNLAIYTFVTADLVSRLAAAVNQSVPQTTPAWNTASVSQALSGGTAYEVAVGDTGASSVTMYRDTGGANERSVDTANPSLAATWTNGGHSSSLYSLYATVTSAPATGPPKPTVQPVAAVQRASNW